MTPAINPIAIDREKLRWACTASIDEVLAIKAPKHDITDGGPDDNRWRYISRPENTVLGVAHVDVVGGLKNEFDILPMDGKDENKEYAWTPYGDDRAGVYTLLFLLPLLGLRYDILLTTGEETGKSSAKLFHTDKAYNWIFEFDRQGTDTVMYSYEKSKLGEDKFFDKLLALFGLTLGNGTYSDIESLQALGVIGFNIGTAYYQPHSQDSYIDMDGLLTQAKKFASLYKAMSEVKLPFERKIPISTTTYQWGAHPKGYTPPKNSNVVVIPPREKIDWATWRKRDWFCDCPTGKEHRKAKEKSCKVCGLTKSEYIKALSGLGRGVIVDDDDYETNWATSLEQEAIDFRATVRSVTGFAIGGETYEHVILPYLSDFSTNMPVNTLIYRLNSRGTTKYSALGRRMTSEEVFALLEDDLGASEFINGELDYSGNAMLRKLSNLTKSLSDSGQASLYTNIRYIMCKLELGDVHVLVKLSEELSAAGLPVTSEEIMRLKCILVEGKEWKNTDLWLTERVIDAPSANSGTPSSNSNVQAGKKNSQPLSPKAGGLRSTQLN